MVTRKNKRPTASFRGFRVKAATSKVERPVGRPFERDIPC